jgi:hypothetical protein
MIAGCGGQIVMATGEVESRTGQKETGVEPDHLPSVCYSFPFSCVFVCVIVGYRPNLYFLWCVCVCHCVL